ncbi:Clp protease [Salmonella enterica]|nr:Clp protease [Salmonella enterica]EBD4848265.1 Clp protease [Salmonella enterica]EBD9028660.1 Clp protease [Salmonella enterica]EBN1956173.1 Clp protease [Salmonella enterica]EBR1417599.1 Clp protease [Salmonella enterica]
MTFSQNTQFFLAKSDVSQLKERYSGSDGERIAEAIRQNCNIWYPLKPGDEGQ